MQVLVIPNYAHVRKATYYSKNYVSKICQALIVAMYTFELYAWLSYELYADRSPNNRPPTPVREDARLPCHCACPQVAREKAWLRETRLYAKPALDICATPDEGNSNNICVSCV